jgi:Transcription factor WhiB
MKRPLELARAICAACPFRQWCYDVAMADASLVGSGAAGFSVGERREIGRAVA